jgi:hypothetical protein
MIMANQDNNVKMSDIEFRAILDLWMCCDPWPVMTETRTGDLEIDVANCDREHHDICEGWLIRECKARGFDGWADAYHDFYLFGKHEENCRCPTGTPFCPNNKETK